MRKTIIILKDEELPYYGKAVKIIKSGYIPPTESELKAGTITGCGIPKHRIDEGMRSSIPLIGIKRLG